MKKFTFRVILILFVLIITQFAHAQAIQLDSGKYYLNHFYSNGSEIQGWHWLRDADLQDYAEWILENIPEGLEVLRLQMTVLATSEEGGGKGHDARFTLSYGIPNGEIFEIQSLILPNITKPDDPVGYTCRGEIEIPTWPLYGSSKMMLRAERKLANGPHVAFQEKSLQYIHNENVYKFEKLNHNIIQSSNKQTIGSLEVNLYPHAKIDREKQADMKAFLQIMGQSMNITANAKVYFTMDSPEDVITYYQDEMKRQGWTLRLNITSDEGGMIAWEKGSKRVQILTGLQHNETIIILGYSENK